MKVPEDPPETCPSCGDDYESVSRHAGGFVVNLLDNDRYRRVCFRPATLAGEPALDCYHHTHEAVGSGDPSDGDAGGSDDADQPADDADQPADDADPVAPTDRTRGPE